MKNSQTLRTIALSIGLALALYGLEGQCAGPMPFFPDESHHHPPAPPPKPPMQGPRVLPPTVPAHPRTMVPPSIDAVRQRMDQKNRIKTREAAALNAIHAAVDDVLTGSGWQNTIYCRVPSGQSCVEASEDRGRSIVKALETRRAQGQLSDLTVKVGTRSGYQLPGGVGSLHTYTVIEVYDPKGNRLDTIEADDYLGPADRDDKADLIGVPKPVDWNSTSVQPMGTVSPQAPTSQGGASQTAPTTGGR